MGLFGRKEKNEPAQEFSFVLAGGFRGYKKYPIVVYGDAEAEKNNADLGDAVLKGKQIIFRSTKTNGAKASLQVFIEGKKVGSVFDEAKVSEMLDGKIEAVYAMMEDENVAGGGKIVTRHRVRIFVKYKEI